MSEQSTVRFRWLRQLIKFFFAGLVTLVTICGLAVGFISVYPLPLDHFKGFIEQQINQELAPYRASFARGELVWAGIAEGIAIQINDMVLYDHANQAVVKLPQLSINLTTYDFLEGHIALKSIDIFGAEIFIARQKNQNFALGFAGRTASQTPNSPAILEDNAPQASIQAPIQTGLAALDGIDFLKNLETISIYNGTIFYSDTATNTAIQAESFSLTLAREARILDATYRADLFLKAQKSPIYGGVTLNLDSLEIAADVTLEKIPFQTAFEQIFAPVNDFAFQGPLKVSLNMSGKIGQPLDFIDIDLNSAYGPLAGNVRYDMEQQTYQGNWQAKFDKPAELAVIHPALSDFAGLAMPLALNLTTNGQDITSLPDTVVGEIKLAAGSIVLPANMLKSTQLKPINLGGISANISLNIPQKKLVVKQGVFDLGDSSLLKVEAEIAKQAQNFTVATNAVFEDFDIQRLDQFLPPSLGKNVQEWIKQNLTGDVTMAQIEAEMTLDHQGLIQGISHLGGNIALENATVQYLEGLPRVKNANATGEFGADWLEIAVISGEVLDTIRINNGQIKIHDIGGAEHITIDLNVDGDLRETLSVLDQDPLAYLKKLTLNPTQFTGAASTQLAFAFPLLNDLKIEEIRVNATALLQDVGFENGPYGIDLTTKKLDLVLNNDGMKLSGKSEIKGKIYALNWYENFVSSNAAIRDISIEGPITPDILAQFSLPHQAFFAGTAMAKIQYHASQKEAEKIALQLDLTETELSVTDLGWRKEIGRDASLDAEVAVTTAGGVNIDRFHLLGDDLDLRGSLAFLPNETWPNRVKLPVIQFDENDFSLTMAKQKMGYEVEVEGKYLDASILVNDFLEPDMPPAEISENSSKASQKTEQNKPLKLKLDVQNFKWDEITATQLDMDFIYDGNFFERIALVSNLAHGAKLAMNFGERAGRRSLVVQSENIGALAKALQISDQIEGGALIMRGTQAQKGQPIAGTIEVGEFTVKNATLFIKLLEFMSLTGTLKALTTSGLDFSALTSDFAFTNRQLALSNGRMHGNSLGLTFGGDVDLEQDTLALNGMVVPIYSVNRILGAIPIVGKLVTGGDGGGLFAASYKLLGTTDAPALSINPVSVLTPGFLRRLFGMMADAGKQTDNVQTE